VAQRFLDAVDNAVHRMARDPLAHPTDIRNSRWVKVRKFPFRLIFEQLGSKPILILAVAHHRRRPGYWQKRHD
jgi:hypothetical protein